MIETFATTGEKEWIVATITIDGTTFENVGVRLKGNSSLFGLTEQTADDPSSLPWLVKLDKYVDGQAHQGYHDLVIRSNGSETSLNEAVALELLEAAGLASQQAMAVAFSVNGGDSTLRLAIEHPDEVWVDANFDSDQDALYKADSEGDYSYRGDDPDAYEDVFNQKAGEDDLEPLMDFLEFINTSDDATFAAELDQWLDVDAFATYLAFQDLVDNFDDIDGPGNNSYLHYDYETERFTVVSWDLNLAFGASPAGGGGQAGASDKAQTAPSVRKAHLAHRRVGGGRGGDNVLATRFMENAAFAELVTAATADLTTTLYDSGLAADVVADWAELLSTDGTALLVDSDVVESEAAAVSAAFPTAP